MENQDDKDNIKLEDKVLETPSEIKSNTSSVDYSDIFVSENDTFDVSQKYYMNKDVLMVEDLDENFDKSLPCKEIILTVKYPDQADCHSIMVASPKFNTDLDKMDIRDFLRIELTRLIILVRKWNLDRDLTSKNIMSMHPKILKGLISKIRLKISMEGIL